MSERARSVTAPRRSRKSTASTPSTPTTWNPLAEAGLWLQRLGAASRVPIGDPELAAGFYGVQEAALGAVQAWGTPAMVRMAIPLAEIVRQRCDAAAVLASTQRRAA